MSATRVADGIALATAAAWLGANIAVTLVTIILVRVARTGEVDATPEAVFELIGRLFIDTAWIGLGLALGLLFLAARTVGWALRLRRHRFRARSLIGVLAAVAVVVCAALGTVSIVDTGRLRDDWTRADEMAKGKEGAEADAARADAAARHALFDAAHRRSTSLGAGLCASLALSIGVLTVSLSRREEGVDASAGGARA